MRPHTPLFFLLSAVCAGFPDALFAGPRYETFEPAKKAFLDIDETALTRPVPLPEGGEKCLTCSMQQDLRDFLGGLKNGDDPVQSLLRVEADVRELRQYLFTEDPEKWPEGGDPALEKYLSLARDRLSREAGPIAAQEPDARRPAVKGALGRSIQAANAQVGALGGLSGQGQFGRAADGGGGEGALKAFLREEKMEVMPAGLNGSHGSLKVALNSGNSDKDKEQIIRLMKQKAQVPLVALAKKPDSPAEDCGLGCKSKKAWKQATGTFAGKEYLRWVDRAHPSDKSESMRYYMKCQDLVWGAASWCNIVYDPKEIVEIRKKNPDKPIELPGGVIKEINDAACEKIAKNLMNVQDCTDYEEASRASLQKNAVAAAVCGAMNAAYWVFDSDEHCDWREKRRSDGEYEKLVDAHQNPNLSVLSTVAQGFGSFEPLAPGEDDNVSDGKRSRSRSRRR